MHTYNFKQMTENQLDQVQYAHLPLEGTFQSQFKSPYDAIFNTSVGIASINIHH